MLSTGILTSVGPGEVYLSPMTEHDLLEVVEIEEASGLSRWGWEAYHAELIQGNSALMIVAHMRSLEQSGAPAHLAGFVAARLNADELHINNIAVRDVYRRYGIGSTLLQAVLKEGARQGGRRSLLEVRAANEAAQKLYQKHGFRVIARRSNYYSQPLEDALVMSTVI